jgi:chemotaxis methyl-accepting protein methylase
MPSVAAVLRQIPGAVRLRRMIRRGEHAVAAVLRQVPGAVRLRRMIRRGEHAVTLRLARRRNYTFTQFCRLPTQVLVLAGPVLDFLRAHAEDDEFRVVVFGCSIGAEPYSIASTLRAQRPGLRFRVDCFDVEPSVIARAQSARYSRDEVLDNPHVPADFIARTFDASADGLTVKPEIANTVGFSVGNVLDAALVGGIEQADVVVAQNFLYHLARPDAERAFASLFALLKPRAALLVDGADIDMRTRLTKEAGLQPCPIDLERIHEESRVKRGYAWPRVYWGLEPFDPRSTDATRRYATIFLRGS